MSRADDRTGTNTGGRWPQVALTVVGALLVAGGWFLPLWRATLHAPQYPGGLTMRAYGHDVTGDVNEISGLNHYVGMRAFDLADFPEIALWPYAVAVALVAVVVGLLVRNRLVRLLAMVYLWGTPVGVLAVIQLRLHQYGHDLDPGAALRIEPFTPLVVGPTEVWNFMTWSWPGLGLISLLLAAALVSFGPRLVRRFAGRRGADTAVLLLAVLGLHVPAPAAASQAAEEVASAEPAPVVAEIPDHPHAGELQPLVDGAEPGDRVVVPPGTYHGQVVIDVPIVLEGRDLPLLLGDGKGTVLTVRAPGTVIRGIAVRGSGPGPTGNPAGIQVEADEVTVEHSVVEDSYIGIAVDGAASIRLEGNVVRGRESATPADEAHAVEHDESDTDQEHRDHDEHDVHGDHDEASGSRHRAPPRGDGIRLHDVDHALVRDNHIAHTRDGVYVSFGSHALIDGNRVRESRYAVHSMYAEHLSLVENHFEANLSGAVLMYRGPALLLRNHIEGSTSGSTGFAVLLKDVTDVEAVENVLVGNRVGIHLDGPTGSDTSSRFTRNTVVDHAIGISAYSSAQAAFRMNSFVDNTVQVLPQGGPLRGIAWADEGWGNFWGTYRGYEGRASGRGAIPHHEGGAVDRLLGRNPELLAISDTPALRLLRTVEERWGRQDPVLSDELPITEPVSPAVPVPTPEPGVRTAALLAGLVLLLPSAALLAGRPLRNLMRRSLS